MLVAILKTSRFISVIQPDSELTASPIECAVEPDPKNATDFKPDPEITRNLPKTLL